MLQYLYATDSRKEFIADGSELVFSLSRFIDQFVAVTHVAFELSGSL